MSSEICVQLQGPLFDWIVCFLDVSFFKAVIHGISCHMRTFWISSPIPEAAFSLKEQFPLLSEGFLINGGPVLQLLTSLLQWAESSPERPYLFLRWSALFFPQALWEFLVSHWNPQFILELILFSLVLIHIDSQYFLYHSGEPSFQWEFLASFSSIYWAVVWWSYTWVC